MLITITDNSEQATDLGFIPHENPANLHSADSSSATEQKCAAEILRKLVEPLGYQVSFAFH